LGTFVWDFPFEMFRVRLFDRDMCLYQLSLRNFRLETLALEIRLGTLTWKPSLDNFRWELRLGTLV
jgi:hypothetical protein